MIKGMDMVKNIAIIGASGHGKVVADIAAKNGYEEIFFLDDNEKVHECGGYPVVGKSIDAKKIDADFVVGIGNAEIRKRIMEMLDYEKVVSLIHPDAVIANDVSIGAGTVVMAGTVINPGTVIGKGCIINTCSPVDHDCRVDDFVHIAVGSHLCGRVTVGNSTWIGAGVTVSNNVNICGGCMIGVGAAIVKDIEMIGTYVGIPARRIPE